jgi:SAM-dependent methyltransferase
LQLSESLQRKVLPVIRAGGREAFLSKLPRGAKTLDVGCGNNSPARTKRINPHIYYIGLDIGDYNQCTDSKTVADEYLVASRETFATEIERLVASVDAVISSHNIEHCDEPQRVLSAMCAALKPNGRLYLSFPSEASVSLPRRRFNTLNFYDDPTHSNLPSFLGIVDTLRECGLIIEKAIVRHRPLVPAVFGFMLEPISYALQRSMPLGVTWALYGFESVIWAKRPLSE